mgnify:CR=1 FL=1
MHIFYANVEFLEEEKSVITFSESEISYISKNINEIYMQQWVYILWFVYLLGRKVLHINFSLYSVF